MNKNIRIGLIITITLLVLVGTYFGLNSLTVIGEATDEGYDFVDLKCSTDNECETLLIENDFGSQAEIDQAKSEGVKFVCENYCRVIA